MVIRPGDSAPLGPLAFVLCPCANPRHTAEPDGTKRDDKTKQFRRVTSQDRDIVHVLRNPPKGLAARSAHPLGASVDAQTPVADEADQGHPARARELDRERGRG